MRHDTETTASTTSAGKPASCMMVIGLPLAGRRNRCAQDFRHGVAADIGVLEHEGVTRIVADGFDARDQLVIDHARRAVFELAHALVDQRDQIDQRDRAPACRRCSRQSGGSMRLQPDRDRRSAYWRIDALRHRNDLGEDFDFLLTPGRPPKKTSTISSKLNSQNGSFRLRGLSTSARSPKQRPYSLWTSSRKIRRSGRDSQHLVQQQRHAARLADAGRAEHREMLGQHLLDIDIGDDGRILLQGADIDLIRSGRRIDRAQLLIADQFDGIADGRIVGDAALEFGAAPRRREFRRAGRPRRWRRRRRRTGNPRRILR